MIAGTRSRGPVARMVCGRPAPPPRPSDDPVVPATTDLPETDTLS